MKKPILLLALACCCFAARADRALSVNLADGGSEKYLLVHRPSVRFETDRLTIHYDGAATTYVRGDVSSFSFVDEPSSGVDSATTEDNLCICTGDRVLAPGHRLRLFSLTGLLLSESDDELQLENLPSGIYLVNVNNRTIKIIRR